MTVISRVGVKAKPAKNHPEFKEWETAKVVVLVAANGREETLARAGRCCAMRSGKSWKFSFAIG
ncbi:MAG: hypothetical protein QM811_03755 [Pirellulales bacterium]